jgi:hypothetical protein
MKLCRIVFAGFLAALSACAVAPQYVDIAVYARRAPAPGQPSLAESVKYIDDGLRYVDPATGFFIAPDGRMCFRGAFTLSQTIFDWLYKTDWCLSPTAVNQVELVPDIVTGKYQLQLSCKHAAGQCIAETGSLLRQANLLMLPIVPPRQEKAAIEHLVWLMGGSVSDGRPFQ